MRRRVYRFSMPAKTPRRREYRSRSTEATLRKQTAIRRLLSSVHDGLTVTEVARALGVSRQLALYHLKKLAATCAECVMVLEPCEVNGGLRFRVWDRFALACAYSRELHAEVIAAGRGLAAAA